MKTRQRGKALQFMMSFLVTAFLFFFLCGCESDEMRSAKETFTNEQQRIEAQNSELTSEIETAESLVATEELPLDPNTIPELENAISTAKTEIIDIPQMPSNIDEIEATTAELQQVDLEDAINELVAKETALSESIEKMKLVTNPSETYVIERLQGVSSVGEIAAVTEDNDPNGHLGKAGGYTAAVYFMSPLVNQADVIGDGVIDSGTDGGGCIEVYANAEDANERNDYLANFDGSVLASGSHKVIGTVLVRTSNELKASQQAELEAQIIEALTTLA